MQRYLLIAFLLIISSLPLIEAFGQEITIIKGKDGFGPYDQAVAGFRNVSSANITEYVLDPENGLRKEIIRKIRSASPDLILTIGLNASLLVKDEITDIPVVFCIVVYPEKHSLTSKDRDNINGISLDVPVRDQMNALKFVIPDLEKVGTICNPQNTGRFIEKAEKILEGMGVDLLVEKIDSRKKVPGAFRKLIKKGIEAFWMLPDSTIVTIESFKFLLLSSYDNNIPLMAYSEKFVEAGALLSLSLDYYSIGEQAAMVANKILHEKNPYLAKVIEPGVLNLVINLKTAKKIHLDIPVDAIASAKKVLR